MGEKNNGRDNGDFLTKTKFELTDLGLIRLLILTEMHEFGLKKWTFEQLQTVRIFRCCSDRRMLC